jgi:hypothetical protein
MQTNNTTAGPMFQLKCENFIARKSNWNRKIEPLADRLTKIHMASGKETALVTWPL